MQTTQPIHWIAKWTASFQKRNSNAIKYVEKNSAFLTVTEFQIETSLGFYLTPVRLSVIRQTNKINAGKDVAEGKPHIWLAGCTGPAVMEVSTLGSLKATANLRPEPEAPGYLPEGLQVTTSPRNYAAAQNS